MVVGTQTYEQRNEHRDLRQPHQNRWQMAAAVTTASRKMIVRPDRRMVNAISLGVFWREAPSTSAIMRIGGNVSLGFAVMRTSRKSDKTLVPPVTADSGHRQIPARQALILQ